LTSLTRHYNQQAVGVPRRTGDGHLIGMQEGLGTDMREIQISNFIYVTCARTLGSWMVSAGASLPAIGKQLGSNVATTQIYSRMNLDEHRPFVNLAVAAHG
jgi:hypothetical protein